MSASSAYPSSAVLSHRNGAGGESVGFADIISNILFADYDLFLVSSPTKLQSRFTGTSEKILERSMRVLSKCIASSRLHTTRSIVLLQLSLALAYLSGCWMLALHSGGLLLLRRKKGEGRRMGFSDDEGQADESRDKKDSNLNLHERKSTSQAR